MENVCGMGAILLMIGLYPLFHGYVNNNRENVCFYGVSSRLSTLPHHSFLEFLRLLLYLMANRFSRETKNRPGRSAFHETGAVTPVVKLNEFSPQFQVYYRKISLRKQKTSHRGGLVPFHVANRTATLLL